MEVFRFVITQDEDVNRREAYKRQVNLCQACETPYQFEIEFTEDRLVADERVSCPCCGRGSVKSHAVQ